MKKWFYLIMMFAISFTIVFFIYDKYMKDRDLTVEKLELSQIIADSFKGDEIKPSKRLENVLSEDILKRVTSSEIKNELKRKLDNRRIYMSNYYNIEDETYDQYIVTAPLTEGMTFSSEEERLKEEDRLYKQGYKKFLKEREKRSEKIKNNIDERLHFDREKDDYYILAKDVDLTDSIDLVEYRESRVELNDLNSPLGYDNMIRNPIYNFVLYSKSKDTSDENKKVDTYIFKSVVGKEVYLYVYITYANKSILDYSYRVDLVGQQ